MPCGNCFGYGGHADGIRSYRGKSANLGGGLVLRPGGGHIDARFEGDVLRTGCTLELALQSEIVAVGLIGEARTPDRMMRADQGTGAHPVDVVRDEHQITRPKVLADAAGRVGEHRGTRARMGGDPDAVADLVGRAALVEVYPSGQHQDRGIADPSGHDLAGVTAHARSAEAGEVGHREPDRLVEGLGERTQPRTEHDGDVEVTADIPGVAPEDIDVQLKEGLLTIKGEKQTQEENKGEVLYQGIAARAFERVFQLADHVQVKGATIENGLLHVDLVREIPEAKKPRQIPIGNARCFNGNQSAQTRAPPIYIGDSPSPKAMRATTN